MNAAPVSPADVDPAQLNERLDILEEVYGIEMTSFVRYLLDNAEVQVRDDFDRKVRSFLVDWYRAIDLNRTAFIDLLNQHGRVAPTFGYPLRFSEYNYLKAAYLLKSVIRLMEQSLEQIALRARGLGDWESARQLVEAVVERERPFLDRARELEAERPREKPAPARIRGTSASRW